MPQERIGVIVFVIGDHCASLYNTVSYNVYERLLGMSQTPWSQRTLETRLKGKKAGTEARSKAGAGQVQGTKPSHALADYVGEYEHPAYGVLKIGLKEGQLQYDFHKMKFPMTHFHYDRFDTPDDEHYGKASVNFQTSPQGDVDKATMSLDEAEVFFTRRAEALPPGTLEKLAGTYETATGFKIQVVLEEGVGALRVVIPGQPGANLVPYKGLQFRTPQFADMVFEFVMEGGQVTSLKLRDPSGENVLQRK